MTVIDPASLTWFVYHRLLKLLGPKTKNQVSGNGYCTKNHESHYQTRLGALKWQAGLWLTVALKEKKGEKIKMPVVEYYKEILFTDEKILTVEETFNKKNNRVHSRLSKETRELVPRIKWGYYLGLVSHYLRFFFCEKGVKTAERNQWDILTNVEEPLNQTMFQKN